ncbi:MAG: VWA domain-containing protein [Crocinitomicaceae bacterium]|nr:VWA domain-containing protein [Crocinitomicaceae bacterium]
MKKSILFSLFLFFLIPTAVAQGKFTYNLKVFDSKRMPKAGLEVVTVETSTFVRTVYKTDANGAVAIELKEEDGKQWVLHIGEMRNYTVLNVSPGSEGSGSGMVTYNPAHWKRQNQKTVDRSTLVLEDIPQRYPENAAPGANHEIVEVYVKSDKGRAYMGLEVKMVDVFESTSYSATTDDKGIARFKLPLNHKYQIDLDGEPDFSYYDTGERPLKKKLTLTYEKLNFEEVEDDEGFTTQIFREAPKPVSNRVMVMLKIFGGPNEGKNEMVYVQTNYSSRKYKGKTDENGMVIFMLPKKKTYNVSFEFQENAGAIDLSNFFGIGEMMTGVYYEPDPRLQFPENYLPTADDVNQYDLNNYSDKVYGDTDDDELLNVHLKWGNNKINSGSMEALLELGFSIKEPADKKAISKPLNIAFVLDKSGSMSGERIDLLKEAMYDFVEKLRPEDRVTIVFFDTEAVVAYDKQGVDKNYLKDIIGAAQADGGTSIYEGLTLGFQKVEEHQMGNSIDRVILLTDGYGSKPVDFILDESKKYFEKGISVSTIGVGEGYNHSLLSMISEYSGGLAHQAIESAGITEAMDKEFESLMYPVASNLRVKVKYNNRVIYKTLYGVPEKKNKDGVVVFELPRVYTSLNRMVLMKFKIENPDKDIDKNKISIEIDYYDEVKQADVSIVKETNLEWTDETDAEMIRDKEVQDVYTVAVINQTLKVIADYCDNQEYEAAQESIKETLKSLRKTNDDKFSPELTPLIEELEDYLVYIGRAMKK